MAVVSKYIDTSTCIGCKACEVACQEWNDQEFTMSGLGGSYQTMPDLAYNFWNLIKFNEEEQDGRMSWLMAKYQCMHCVDPACSDGCPVMAYEKDETTGIVRHLDDQCIGCQYCVLKCPYDVPKYSKKRGIIFRIWEIRNIL